MLESDAMTTLATSTLTEDNLTGLLIEWRQGDKARSIS